MLFRTDEAQEQFLTAEDEYLVSFLAPNESAVAGWLREHYRRARPALECPTIGINPRPFWDPEQ